MADSYEKSTPETLNPDEKSIICEENSNYDQNFDNNSNHVSEIETDDEDDDPVLCQAGLRLVTCNPNFELSKEDVVLCINCGGKNVKDSWLGIEFNEDSGFSESDKIRTEEEIGVSDKGPCIYQSARYGSGLCYQIENLTPGDYVVDLHFAEIVFTQGPPGMRIFDVTLQQNKILAGLDIFARVGANAPLVLVNARAKVGDDGNISLRFDEITGNPIVCGICIRKEPLVLGPDTKRRKVESPVNTATTTKMSDEDFYIQREKTTTCDDNNGHRIRKKDAKLIAEYETKVKELTKALELSRNECHEAWMSLDHCNSEMERLRTDLDNKTITESTRDQMVVTLANQLKTVQSKFETEKKIWISAIADLSYKIQMLKRDHSKLSEEAKMCVSAIPGISGMTNAVQSLVFQVEDLKRKYSAECIERKLLYNKVLELKGNIRVFCRCRPLNAQEISAGASSITEFDTTRENELSIRNGATKKSFKFDRVFSPQDDQVTVFGDTAPVVVSVLDGYNVCIFAYGQTGTGKTFTMEGTNENRGVNYRTLEELFKVANDRKELFNYSISVSVLEVYNEQIRDLLAPPVLQGQAMKKLEIKQIAEGFHNVPGLIEAHVHTMNEVWEVLQTGSSARAVGATNANDHSSRSHCLLCVMVKGENVISGECTRSKLWLVDLAGSERVAKTDAQGDRLKEAQSINKSLSALGDVISALANKSGHIPYRNSKLTHLLQDSLGGDSKTLMFVQISPGENDSGETLSSLNFATRVRGVELGPARKQVDNTELLKYKQLAEKVKQESRAKDEEARKLEEILQCMDAKLRGKEQISRSLQERVKELEDRLEITINEQKHQAEEGNVQYLEYVNKLKEEEASKLRAEEMCRRLEEKVKLLETQLQAKVEQQLLEAKFGEETTSKTEQQFLVAKLEEETSVLADSLDGSLVSEPFVDIQARIRSEENVHVLPCHPSERDSVKRLKTPDVHMPSQHKVLHHKEYLEKQDNQLPSRHILSKRKSRASAVPTFGRATAASNARTLSSKNEISEIVGPHSNHHHPGSLLKAPNHPIINPHRDVRVSVKTRRDKTTTKDTDSLASSGEQNLPPLENVRAKTFVRPRPKIATTVHSQRPTAPLHGRDREAKMPKWGR